MTNEARTAELQAMTAKGLRPIAAALGITGASRMNKAGIIAAIVAVEGVKSEFTAAGWQGTQGIAVPWLCAHGTAPDTYCDGCNAEKPAYAAQVDKVKAMRATVLEQAVTVVPSPQDLPEIPEPAPGAVSFDLTTGEVHGPTRADFLMSQDWDAAQARRLGAAHAAAIILDQDRSIYRWVTNLSDAEATAPTDWIAVAEYADERRPHFTEEQWARLAVKAADDNAIEYPNKLHETQTAEAPILFLRPTRRGVEKVLVEDVLNGTVRYRYVSNYTGKTSAVYTMREKTFARQYTPASV